MKLLLTISVLTTVSAIRVPNWQQQQDANLNNANRDVRPLRQEANLAQPVPNYNNANAFVNNVPNPAANGLVANGNLFSNLPANYNWFTGGVPNNAFGQINSGNLLNNNINPFLNNGNNIRTKPYVQPGPPRLAQVQRDFNRRPPTLNNFDQGEGQGQVPYITYTTQGPAPQSAAFGLPKPDQNLKQAYPQVSNPKTAPLLTEIDFSPRQPFRNQQEVRPSNQVNNQNYVYSTSAPVRNLDFSLNDPFPVSDFQLTQVPQVPASKPLNVGANRRIPQYNPTAGLRNVDFNPFAKNYRDHRTHEPTQYDPHYDREAVPIVERKESEKAPIVRNHEHPEEVPTRPIYPGEGQWAKPGRKHRPFVSKQQYSNLDENERPDGYDVFLEGQQLFNDQKQQFGQRLQQSPSNTHAPVQQSSAEENTDGEIFVPTRLYAQVRHSEDEKHLPPESDENGRLKELVKDTKIQTIYSEEGFEDSAYDHAGHEKKAENTEDFESDEKDEEVKEKKKIPLKKHNHESSSYSIGDQNLKEEDIEKLKKEDLNLENETTESNDDSETAGTHYEQSYLNKIQPTKYKIPFIKSKEIKTVTAKDRGGGKIEMEISSEVKAVVQPNNSTKIHKYVKIYPKISDRITTENDIPDDENVTSDSGKQFEADRRSLSVDSGEIFIEEITNHTTGSSSIEYVPTTVTPTEYTEIVTMEIPKTTQATTAIPKLESVESPQVESNEEIQSIKNINKAALRLKLKRRRRSAPQIPTIEIDTDFIDKINHDIGKPTEKSNKQVEKKYPYYKQKQKGLHEDSPLRYSEDLKNVPIKTNGKLAFYDLADRKMACPDVNPEVDPVPDRVKNADESVEDEEEDEEGNDPATKAPRLGQLGDRIDCFKLKYFGENPLDNPIFQEKSVGPIKPIFSEIENISTKKIGGIDSTNKASNLKSIKREINAARDQLDVAASSHDLDNEIEDGKPYKFRLTSWFPGKNFGIGENTERDSKFVNHFVDKNPHLKSEVQSKQSDKSNDDDDSIKAQNSKQSSKEVQTLPPATLITTPKYTIELQPKHIYDQIQLLEYLPEDEIAEIRKEINERLPKNNISEVTTSSPGINKTETVINKPLTKKKKKKSGKKFTDRKGKALKDAEESMKMETSDNIDPGSFPESDALQLVRPKQKKPLYEIFDINKYLPKVPKIVFPAPIISTPNPNKIIPVSIVKPTFEVFDINKYLPTTPFPLFKEFITRSTVLPKYKVISEVFYKEDIKPNEQFNVFTDILNNIRNFPRLKDNFPESSETISVKLNPEHVSEAENDKKDYFSSTVTTLMTTFDPKTYASNHKYLQSEDPVSAGKHIESILNNFKTNSKPKRRRRVKTTTQETPMIIEESTSTLQYIGEPTEVIGLMPPVIQGYKTIYHPKRDSSQHIANPTIRIEERKINKYFVQGMRPPPKQKIYLYSDFLTDNHIEKSSKPKRSKLRRSRRSAQRPAYAQVSRNRNKSSDAETQTKKEEEDDDYVPHRPKNYHYDEKTGKIVYDKKPETPSQEEEEVEYIEVVEETPKTTENPKPKQNPIFATATPPPAGQSYTDFVKLLKSASNYHEIPDPTTTEKGAEEVTQKMAASTLQPVATSPPEFLSILAKVRNDTTYKLIEDKKKTTSTSKPEEVTEEVEEESQVEDVRNSPGGQGYEAGTNLEIFDITDFLPNIKSYLPKTSVDTSKYKTIERPQLRHSLSSRYNSEEEKDLQNVNTSKQPIISNSERPVIRRNQQEQTRKIPPTVRSTTTSTPEVTTTKTVRSTRRRTTTEKPVTVENSGSSTETSLTTEEPTTTVTTQNKPKRNRRRRRRPKRIKATPPTEDSSETETDNTTQAIHRRAERESHMLAASNENYEQVVETDADLSKPLIRMEDYVDYEEITDNANTTDAQQLKDISVVAKEVVDVFKNYDKLQRHGGNYKKEDEANKDNLQKNETALPEKEKVKLKGPVEVIKPYDKTKKHGGNYKAEKEDLVKPKEQANADLKDAKKVEVFKDYDKSKKHGGNYRPAPEEININENDESGLEKRESIQIENVNVFQDYDKTKKHGGNYKAEKDTPEKSKANIGLEKPTLLKNVEVFKDYDKTKKHGGNYKSETNIPEQQLEESQYGAPQSRQNLLNAEPGKGSSVEVFKNYDKSKKHGGNYARENESKEKNVSVKQQTLVDQNKDVETFKNYDENKKTGGNYRREEEVGELNADETKPSKFEATQQKRYVASRNDVQRLADVVLKPEAIYSDLNLPLDINALNIVQNLTNEELEEIADSAEIDIDADKDKDDSFKNEDSATRVVNIGNKLKIPPVVEAPITTTKKPLFIKDPSKRLYFYAPVR